LKSHTHHHNHKTNKLIFNEVESKTYHEKHYRNSDSENYNRPDREKLNHKSNQNKCSNEIFYNNHHKHHNDIYESDHRVNKLSPSSFERIMKELELIIGVNLFYNMFKGHFSAGRRND